MPASSNKCFEAMYHFGNLSVFTSELDSNPHSAPTPVSCYSAAARSSANTVVTGGHSAGTQAVLSGVAAGRTFGNRNRHGLGFSGAAVTSTQSHKRGGNSAMGGLARNPQELIYCDICKISCAGPHVY